MAISRRTFLSIAAGVAVATLPAVAYARRANCYSNTYSNTYH